MCANSAGRQAAPLRTIMPRACCGLGLFALLFILASLNDGFVRQRPAPQLVHRHPLYGKQKRPGVIDAETMEKVRRYTQMRELQRLKAEGASVDDLKAAIANGTVLSSSSSAATSYKKFVGQKGSLEKRLQAVVAYKRSTVDGARGVQQESGLTRDEERDLDAMMESEEGDEDDEGDGEEAEYEAAVMKAIEANKLAEVRRNLGLGDKAERRESASEGVTTSDLEVADALAPSQPGYDPSPGMIRRDPVAGAAGPAGLQGAQEGSVSSAAETEDLYTPARSSWGVFQRPRDIRCAHPPARLPACPMHFISPQHTEPHVTHPPNPSLFASLALS